MSIERDTKDWTWVLEQPCPECGFSAAGLTPASVAAALLDCLPRWDAVLARPDAARRPDESTWSALEYACHVRDVCKVFTGRLELMLSRENPHFPDWDQDAAAIRGNYAGEDAARVARELAATGRVAAAAFGRVPESSWQRRGERSNGSAFTVQTLAQYFWHDLVHHLHDVRG